MFFIGNPSNLDIFMWQPYKMVVQSLITAHLLSLVYMHFEWPD